MTVQDGSTFGEWADYQRFRDRLIGEIDPAYYTAEWLDLQMFTGKFRLLYNGDSAILISFREYPTGLKELHGEFATGELSVITGSLIPAAEALGRASGCGIAIIQSRAGWVKIMKAQGYAKHQTSIRKVL